MVPTGLHFGGWNSPAFGIPIDLAPLHFINHAGAGNGQRIEAQGKADNVTKPRSRPRCADELEDARHVARFSDAGTRRRNVGNHLPIQVAEWIVAVAFDIGVVADLLTDAAHAVAGFQLSLGFVRTHESEHVRTLDVLPAQLAEAILDVADAQLKHLDGLGVAHRDDPAAFDFLHLLLREPLIGPLLERPGGRLPVLVELLLGARVFAFLEQVLGLVALAPRVGERERAILSVAVRADGVGFLAAMEAVAHPPELGGSVAGPALVRRDEEIEAAASHVRNLGGGPRAIVEFRSGGAAVDVRPYLLGVGASAIVLAGHLLNSLVRNSEIRRERLFSRYQQKYQQIGRLGSDENKR